MDVHQLCESTKSGHDISKWPTVADTSHKGRIHLFCLCSYRQSTASAHSEEIRRQNDDPGLGNTSNCQLRKVNAPKAKSCIENFSKFQMSWLLIIFAQNPYYLYASRALAGLVSAGVMTLTAIFATEICNDG